MTGKSESPLVRYLRDPSLLLHDALELAREALSSAVDVAPGSWCPALRSPR